MHARVAALVLQCLEAVVGEVEVGERGAGEEGGGNVVQLVVRQLQRAQQRQLANLWRYAAQCVVGEVQTLQEGHREGLDRDAGKAHVAHDKL